MEFVQQFRAARRVSTPLVALKTFDPASAIEQVKAGLNGTADKTPLIQWDSVHGYRAINDPGTKALARIMKDNPPEASAVPGEALRLAENAGDADAVLIFHNSHLVWSDPSVIQAIWNLRDPFTANGNMLVLLCSPGATLPAELVNDVLMLDEPLPTAGELSKLVADEFKFAKCKAPDDTVLNKATDALIGLPAFAARQSTAMCLDTKAQTLGISDLWERKRQVIAQTPGCSVYKGKETLGDVRGLESVTNFLRKRMSGKLPPSCILFQDEVEKAFAGTGTDTSGTKTELTGSYCTWADTANLDENGNPCEVEGLTFIGLPGVSKSALVKALGNEYGVPVIMFDIAAMQSGLVGSSGANLRAAQKMVSAISRGRLLIISTCNGIDSVPPEIRRRIGSLGTFFFDAPGADERADIWKLYRAKYGIQAGESNPPDEGWTGAEIKQACKKADLFNMTLAESSQYVVPVTRSAGERIKALRVASSGKFLSASNPGTYQYSESEELPPAVPVTVKGRKVRGFDA